jgi:hypothetical protein
MAKIKVNDLSPADSELIKDSGSFMKDFVNSELDVIRGGHLTEILARWYHNNEGPNILRYL